MQIIQEDLVKIINYWNEVAKSEDLYPRDLLSKIETGGRKIVDIVGVRRSGKSSLLRFLYRRFQPGKQSLYINFEDPFFVLHNGPEVIEELMETFLAYFSKELKYIFLDEVQKIMAWERAVRKYEEGGKFKFFVSGSSANLLKGELSKLLTGRHRSSHLLPLSFAEFLRFRKFPNPDKKDFIIQEKELNRQLKDYLLTGGFPEVVLGGKSEELRELYGDILQKDVIGRFEVRDRSTIEKMGVFLLENIGNLVSQRGIGRLYDLSLPAVKNYLDYLEQSFLVYFVSQYSFSLKTSDKALKKVYAGDTGLAGAVSLKFSENLGRNLENAVFLELLRRGEEIYYFRSQQRKEVDFIISKRGQLSAIAVCWDLNDQALKREIDSLQTAKEELKIKKLSIVAVETNKQKILGQGIKIISAAEWFLYPSNCGLRGYNSF